MIALIALIIQAVALLVDGKSGGPVGIVEVERLAKCKDFEETEAKYTLDLVEVDGHKGIKGHITFENDMDSSIEYRFIANKWENNEFIQDFVTQEGNAYDEIMNYFSKIFYHFMAVVQPPIMQPDFIPAGEYDLMGLFEEAHNIDLPSILYGTFEIKIYLVRDGVDIMCMDGTITTKEEIAIPKAPNLG